MKHKTIIGMAVALAIVFLPVMLSQLLSKEGRKFQGEKLDDSRYQVIEFRNEYQNIDLAVMLFLPANEGPYPAAVIIHGSGTSIRRNRWYLSVAHYLQDRGVAVLLPDKRGSEQSGGDWRSASFEDLATDALAAIQFLKNHGRSNVSRAGFIGMSQGGWIAPIAAERSADVAFLVSVVGSAVSTHEQLIYEENNNLKQAGFLPGVSNVIAFMSTLWIRKIAQKEFWDSVGDFDPAAYWGKLEIPAFALFGEDDSNVPTQRSAVLLRSLENSNIHIKIYEGSGHALQDPMGTGNRIFREDALQDIRDFIGN